LEAFEADKNPLQVSQVCERVRDWAWQARGESKFSARGSSMRRRNLQPPPSSTWKSIIPSCTGQMFSWFPTAERLGTESRIRVDRDLGSSRRCTSDFDRLTITLAFLTAEVVAQQMKLRQVAQLAKRGRNRAWVQTRERKVVFDTTSRPALA